MSDKFRGRKKRPVTFYLCNQVWVPDDGADEEPVVCHFCTFLHLGSAQVKMHLVVGTGHGLQIKIAHPAKLQLEGQGRLQVTVNAIFCKLQKIREIRQTDTHTHTHTHSRVCKLAQCDPSLWTMLKASRRNSSPSAEVLSVSSIHFSKYNF